jgi:hypothetical protein
MSTHPAAASTLPPLFEAVDAEQRAPLHQPALDPQITRYNAHLVARVQREADEATRLPAWFWPVGAVVFALTIAVSHWVTL